MNELEIKSDRFIPRYSFANLPQDFSDYHKAKYVILPVPYDATTTFKTGTREGPLAIINSSLNLEEYDMETKKNINQLNIFTLPEVNPIISSPQDMIENLSVLYEDLLTDQKFVFMLGGEHSLSISAIKAIYKKTPNFSVIQLDAHADLRDTYQGSKFSHACTMRRILEITPNIFQIGIRSMGKEEHCFALGNNLPMLYAEEIAENKKWIEKIGTHTKKKVYLTIDLDALDPSIMPAVGNPVPGGILWYQLLSFLKNLIKEKDIIGVDLMELCPKEGNSASSALAAQLVFKILMYLDKFASI